MVLVLIGSLYPSLAMAAPPVRVGIDVLLSERIELVQDKRLGLLTNTSAIDADGTTTMYRLAHEPRVRLTQLYSPEHGLRLSGANGVGDRSGRDAVTGLPLEGLNSYGAPSGRSLKNIDVLVVDIQDVGSRTFTYATTLGKVLGAAGHAGVPVLVLDRPNPQGREIFEGPVIPRQHRGILGWGPVPVTHGLTLGELARFLNDEMQLRAHVTVVPMAGWHRSMTWEDTGLRWAMPATAVTTPQQAHLYAAAGMVGGAGIDQLDDGVCDLHFFERIAAQYADPTQMAQALRQANLPGVAFEPARYIGRWGPRTGRRYAGVALQVSDPHVFRPLTTALAALVWLRQTYPKQFRVGNKSLFLHIWGSDAVLHGLEQGWSRARIEASWATELAQFSQKRQKYLLYH